jgi:MtN3 and saliva related transmembrane protein
MATPSDLIGGLAAVMTTASFVPQVLLTVRTRDTSGISLWMYLMFSAGVGLWLIYGLLLAAWPLILANGVTLVLALVVLAIKQLEPAARPNAPR